MSEFEAPATALPWRMTTREVCRLGRMSPATLWRRIKAGRMPAPVDHARQALFDRDAVLQSLQPPAARQIYSNKAMTIVEKRLTDLAARSRKAGSAA
jgi:predicted DNA-binding transcriptional regulator AlpA